MSSADERLLRSYLLGQLPAGQREALDVRLLAEPQLAEELEALEDELIRDAIRGELPPVDQDGFDLHFLAIPDHVKRYRWTHAMLLAKGIPTVPLRAASLAHRHGTGGGNAGKLMLIAAAVVIAVLGWQDLALRSRLRESQRLTTRVAEAPVISLFLMPGVERGDASQASVQVPAGARVRLQFGLPASSRRDAYTVVIRNVDTGRQVWGAAAERGGAAVVTEAPASALPAGDYKVVLTGPDGDAKSVEASYQFRVAEAPRHPQ